MSPIDAASWCKALTLPERVALLRHTEHKPPLEASEAQLAERRAARWRAQLASGKVDHLQERLALDGLREEEWLYVLGEPIEAVKARVHEPPAWLRDFVRPYEQPADRDLPAPDPSKLQNKSKDTVDILASVLPSIRQARDRVGAGIRELRRTHAGAPFECAELERLLVSELQVPLISLIDRTLVLEMHVARHRGELGGTTAEERYASFIERIREPEVMLSLFREYPVLARQIATCLEQWVSYGLAFAAHLCADWSDILAMFSPGADPGRIVSLEIGAGDRHRGGRTVMLVGFSGGLRLVYKPKALAVDAHYQQLLAWVNERGAAPPLRTMSVLDRGEYGWLEFVSRAPCTSEAELRRFYRRQGGLTTLLYLLAGTDFHFENLVAAGEHPVLIDLETLFHPHTDAAAGPGAQELAEQTLADSVLRSGLFPQWVWGNPASRGIEISGLGAQKGQQTPFGMPTWEGAGSDTMHIVRRPSILPEGQNRPTLNGADVPLLDYAEDIVEGFTAMYRLLVAHREELSSPGGPLERFAEDEVRVILRPSQRYGVLIHESFHPDLLRSALDRERHFDRLWMGVDDNPLLRRIVAAERIDLHNGDIPMFVTRPGSKDLWSSQGVRFESAFAASGLELVERTARNLGESDLARQVGLIRSSLATLVPETEARTDGRISAASEPTEAAGRDRLLTAARAVGDRLAVLAVEANREASWIGLSLQGRTFASRPVDTGLYAGRTGIALFLGYLGDVTREGRYTELARAAIRSVLREVETRPENVVGIGGFEGWGALVHTLSHLGTLWDEPELLARADDAAQRLTTLIGRDDRFDVVGGAAGGIASLLSLHACAPSERTLAAAVACGEHLSASARPQERGVGWPTVIDVHAPLTGFSHGAAGMAWALLKLTALTHDDRLRTVALSALAYERSTYVPEMENWPDWRKDESSPAEEAVFVNAWCHGAPGIGLSRLDVLAHVDDAETRAEIDVALRTTVRRGFGDNDSLCHGDLGNIDLLLVAAQVLGQPGWLAEAERRAGSVLAGIERRGWICGAPLRVETPGLLIGLAGIGYGLLRLAEPARVPSVLLLSPPVRD